MTSPKSIRKHARKAAEREARMHRNRKIRKVGIVSIAPLIAAGALFNPASAMATDGESYRVEFGSSTFESGTFPDRDTRWVANNPLGPAEQYEVGLPPTDDEVQKLGAAANGEVTGAAELSADADALAAASASGGNLDLTKTEQQTNATTDGSNLNTDPRIHASTSFDEGKVRAEAVRRGLNPDRAYATFAMVRGDQKLFMPHIATNEQWDASTVKAGQKLDLSAQDLGTFYVGRSSDSTIGRGPGLLPIVGVSEQGPMDGFGEFPYALTTVVDPYTDGDSEKRQQQIASVNERAMPENTANCLTDDCGFWVVLAIGEYEVENDENGDEHLVRGPATTVTDAFRVHVHTTVSAGKTPDTESFALESGWKGRFIPAIHSDTTNTWEDEYSAPGDYFNDALGAWDLLEEHTRALALLTDTSVALTDLTVSDDGVRVATESNHPNISADHYSDNGQHSLRIESATEVSAWTFNGEALTVGDSVVGYSMVNGVQIGLEGTITVIDGNGITMTLDAQDEDSFAWDIPEGQDPVVDGVLIEVGDYALGAKALITRSPDFAFEVTPQVDTPAPPVVDTPEPPVTEEPPAEEEPPTEEQPPTDLPLVNPPAGEKPPTEEEEPPTDRPNGNPPTDSPQPPADEEPEPSDTPPVMEDVTDLPPEGHLEEVGSAGFGATLAMGGGLLGLLAAAVARLSPSRRKQFHPIKVDANQG